jgi:hypothetical protein
METAPDYSSYQELPTDDKFAQLALFVQRQLDAAADVARCERQLAEAQQKLRQLSEVEFPDFMENVMGLSECRTRDGILVSIKEKIRAGIPVKKDPERAARAFKWLRDNGHSRLIKHVIKVELDKGQDGVAEELLKLLKEPAEKNHLVLEDATTVHEQTLGAFVREKLEAGQLPDDALELLGVHRQKFASLKLGK